MNQLKDSQLVKLYLKGDEKALEILIGRRLKQVYFFVYQRTGQDSDIAQDITQDIFIKMWKNLKSFKQEKVFKAWLFAIAKNACWDFLRKKKTLPIKDANDIIDSALDIADVLQSRQKLEALSLSVKKLSLKYKQIILWRLRENFSFQEIADLSGKPINTVKSLYQRAVIELRKNLPEF